MLIKNIAATLDTEEKCFYIVFLVFLDYIGTPIANLENTLNFVKIIPTKNHNFDLALRKRLFCSAKPTLLPCKTAAFGMQNNRFCKALTAR